MADFTLSIETRNGKTVSHPVHPATAVEARDMAEALYQSRRAKSVGVKRGGLLIDVFDGFWVCMGAAAARFHADIVSTGSAPSEMATYWDDDLIDAGFDEDHAY